jgi:hypothetical protein
MYRKKEMVKGGDHICCCIYIRSQMASGEPRGIANSRMVRRTNGMYNTLW